MEFDKFKAEYQKLFAEALRVMPANEEWSSKDNYSRSRYSLEIDILITKEGKPYVAVELKSTQHLYNRGVVQVLRIANDYHIPYAFVVTPEKFGFLSSKGDVIFERHTNITPKDIINCLSSSLPADFSEEQWSRKIDEVIKTIQQSDDEIINNKSLEICSVLESMKDKDLYQYSKKDLKIKLNDAIEESLFGALLGRYAKDKVCRFTTLSSVFRTVNTKKHSMCSIVAMNDKSETSYVNDYFVQQGFNSLKHLVLGPDDWNHCFITSCCDEGRMNDFTMMRLYADDVRGVSIMYSINHDLLDNSNFSLRQVSYQRDNLTHPELDILIALLSIRVGNYSLKLNSLNRWKHFFKPKEYAIEQEVRLLYQSPLSPASEEQEQAGAPGPNRIWILNQEFNIITPLVEFDITTGCNQYPLKFEEITLGAKMKESYTNQLQLRELFRIHNIENGTNVSVSQSDISNYR